MYIAVNSSSSAEKWLFGCCAGKEITGNDEHIRVAVKLYAKE